MDRLQAMATLVAVVDSGGFTVSVLPSHLAYLR